MFKSLKCRFDFIVFCYTYSCFPQTTLKRSFTIQIDDAIHFKFSDFLENILTGSGSTIDFTNIEKELLECIIVRYLKRCCTPTNMMTAIILVGLFFTLPQSGAKLDFRA